MMVPVTEVKTAHTADLDPATLAAARALLYEVFDDLTEHDWEHSLGGIHALAWEGDELIGHASVIQRRLALERVIRGGYEIGALGATDAAAAFYRARGWQLWQGPSSVLTPAGIRRTPADDGAIYVLPLRARLDLASELTCDWRDGDGW
jgi:aminoglycoside 2'-N-acetyltransferase I